MSWTKRQFIDAAFEEIGLAGYVFDLEPEQLQGALRRLDAMMATWNAKGIRIGYPLPTSPQNSDLDTDTTVPDAANETIYLNLAVRIAPGYGKTVSQDTKASAKLGYDQLIAKDVFPNERQYPGTLPLGAGNKNFGNDQVFFSEPEDPLLAGNDSELEY